MSCEGYGKAVKLKCVSELLRPSNGCLRMRIVFAFLRAGRSGDRIPVGA